MKIASKRTLDDMAIAAELRVHGATRDTFAQVLGRQKRLLMRCVRYYAADWKRLFNEAEQRAARFAVGRAHYHGRRFTLTHQRPGLRPASAA